MLIPTSTPTTPTISFSAPSRSNMPIRPFRSFATLGGAKAWEAESALPLRVCVSPRPAPKVEVEGSRSPAGVMYRRVGGGSGRSIGSAFELPTIVEEQ
mmetsp:Transcript_5630/g.13609  ORF Transcript_5630/g.13609 Transcript_5630/m.13609 type:complete len:98 (-) Transcript_5630:95-388(-)